MFKLVSEKLRYVPMTIVYFRTYFKVHLHERVQNNYELNLIHPYSFFFQG